MSLVTFPFSSSHTHTETQAKHTHKDTTNLSRTPSGCCFLLELLVHTHTPAPPVTLSFVLGSMRLTHLSFLLTVNSYVHQLDAHWLLGPHPSSCYSSTPSSPTQFLIFVIHWWHTHTQGTIGTRERKIGGGYTGDDNSGIHSLLRRQGAAWVLVKREEEHIMFPF